MTLSPAVPGGLSPGAVLLRGQPGAGTGRWAAQEAEGQAWGQAAGWSRNWVRREIGAPNCRTLVPPPRGLSLIPGV